MKVSTLVSSVIALLVLSAWQSPGQVSKEVIDSISTPNKVKTSIGTLRFLDGAPLPKTAEKVYDYLDTMRGVDAFLKGMPGASLHALIQGNHSLGAVECHQVMITDQLMDSQSLFLTANTSTMYVIPTLDLERDGSTVLEAPAGPDKGQGGNYLIIPPGYHGEIPEGYFVVQSKTYKLTIPANPPAKDFWALTMNDNQTRSMLQTSQSFPTVGSQTEGNRKNADGSYNIFFSPKPPKGYENNWLETIPGKDWFVALRIYGPLEPWIEKHWRPGEIERVKYGRKGT